MKSKNKVEILDDMREKDINENRSREDITKTEVLEATNSVNSDLSFTMKLFSDFPGERLPTLTISFSRWCEKDGLKNTYFEKEMCNQTVLLGRTSISRQSIISILSNELRRRLETLDETLSQQETVAIIDKYIQQPMNFNGKV